MKAFLLLVLVAGVLATDEGWVQKYKARKSLYLQYIGLEGYEFEGALACIEDKLLNDRPAGMDVSIFLTRL